MNREETLALYKRGIFAWNQWARLLLDERKDLEESGAWEEAQWDWLNKAKADFSTFQHPQSFMDYVSCEDFIFPGEARFNYATFMNNAWFKGVKFKGEACFGMAKFQKAAYFNSVVFEKEALFDGVRFNKGTRFDGAIFERAAQFESAKFDGKVQFEHAMFAQATWFFLSTFKRPVGFQAMQTAGAFNLDRVKFDYPPNFIHAHFFEPPSLDSITIRNPFIFWKEIWFYISCMRLMLVFWLTGRSKSCYGRLQVYRNKHIKDVNETKAILADYKLNAPAMWRKLKDMAGANKDFQNELDFFAREMKSARGVSDFFYKRTCLRWGAGWLYEIFSDFGRSPLRPLAWWLALTVWYFFLYLRHSPELPAPHWYDPWHKAQACVRASAEQARFGLPEGVLRLTKAPTEALHLALRNGLLFVDGGSESARRTYGCLYGLEAANGDPIVPPAVSKSATFQKLASSVLIFLFGLGVRNLLRMK